MPTIKHLFVRDDSASNSSDLSPTVEKLLIALITLVGAIAILIGALLIVRRHRKNCTDKSRSNRDSHLPLNHNNASMVSLAAHHQHTSSRRSNHRRLTISAAPYHKSDSIFIFNEKRASASFTDNMSNSPPSSPVPEIRITFPDEESDLLDEKNSSGNKRKSGRVVVVRISDNGGVGLEPYNEEENLPPYQSPEAGRFESLDLDRMGGLKEKERSDERWA
ncbi:hypothetical protein MMC25_001219 [Agyrium rufum]|nr:hypothetical protein [Agyrium rufum]